MAQPFPFRHYEADQQHRTDLYSQAVLSLYESAVAEAVRLAGVSGIDPAKPFRFVDYPATQARMRDILTNLSNQLIGLVGRGTADAWTNANVKADAFVQHIDLPPALLSQATMARQSDGLAAFQTRKVGGLNLSQRVFRYQGQLRTDLETGLAIGIGRGESARQLAVSMNQYLVNPSQVIMDAAKIDNPRYRDYIQRRVDNVHPGRGVYKSAYKNAERLTRTEINSAYRTADFERIQGLDFVCGIEVRRSGRLSTCDICGALAGKYPKDFFFSGWHPSCRCFTVPILVSRDELNQLNALTLAGESTGSFQSVNRVDAPHEGWSTFLETNRVRLDAAPAKPLFVSQNGKYATLPKPAIADVVDSARVLGFTVNALEGSTFDAARLNQLHAKTMSGFDLGQFDKEITAMLKQSGITLHDRELSHGADLLQLRYAGTTVKGDPFVLRRHFMLTDTGRRQVEHDYLVVPQALQGKGLAKTIFKSVYTQYQNANIDLLSVHANIDVGGYAWAKYGFSFKNQVDRKMVYSRAVRNLGPTELPAFKTFWEINKEADRFPMHSLAEQPFGKKILLKSDWSGILDLSSERERTLFENYLFGRKGVPVRNKGR